MAFRRELPDLKTLLKGHEALTKRLAATYEAPRSDPDFMDKLARDFVNWKQSALHVSFAFDEWRFSDSIFYMAWLKANYWNE